MDIEESLLRDWEDDVSFPELSDNALNFAIDSSLQLQNSSATDFKSANKSVLQKNEIFLKECDEDLDYALALSLETQYEEQSNENTDIALKNEIFLKGLDEDLDYAFALSLQTQYEEESNENTDIVLKKSSTNVTKDSKPLSIVDEQWELIDPHPDVHALFLEFNTKFFYGKLFGVEVRWSPRMTLCAGVCCYEGRGGLCSVRLSAPLLKLRPRRDLVETLLHEMIHAYLFVTHNNKDREGHGPEFLSHMNRINKETGTRISVYHSFHDEVDIYRTHWWKCDGPCKNRRPFYGLVKRTMNRAPGPNDRWWADHQASCGGKFIKIQEPENYKKKGVKRKPTDSKGKEPLSNVKSFFNGNISKSSSSKNSSKSMMTKSSNISTITSVLVKEENVVPVKSELPKKNFVPFGGGGHKLGGSSKKPTLPSCKSNSQVPHPLFKSRSEFSSSSSVLPKSNPSSQWAKFPRLSDSSDLENTDFLPSTSRKPEMSPRNLVQIPIKKFLSPKKEIVHKSSDIISEGKKIIELNTSGSGDSKVNCPICSLLMKETDINSHLDACLS